MNDPEGLATEGESGWTRVSSFKPYLAAALVICAISISALVCWGGSENSFPLITGCSLVAFGLIALQAKVVYRRHDEYRVATLFHLETVTLEDICMTVKNPRPFWTILRIHLNRPTRFGWAISFVPLPTFYNSTRLNHQR